MALSEKLINSSNEWAIRHLISSRKFPVEGSFQDLLCISDMDRRIGSPLDSKFSKHPILGEAMLNDYTRIQMSITDMVARRTSDMDLSMDDVKMPLTWLRLPSDEDIYHIVLIIRKFLTHQEIVHVGNMTKPSKIERRDYLALKEIYNYLLDDAIDWINRGKYIPVDKSTATSIDDILNSGENVVSFSEDGKGNTRKTLPRYSLGGNCESNDVNSTLW